MHRLNTSSVLALIVSTLILSSAWGASSDENAVPASEGNVAFQGGGEAGDELSRQVTDSAASLMARNFQALSTGNFKGKSPGQVDDRWIMKFRPDIPLEAFDRPNILRSSVPSQSIDRGDEGWGQISIFDLVVSCQLGDGWSLSAGDLQFSCDWEAGRWINAPIGFQSGKITKLGDLLVRLSVNPLYNLIDDTGLAGWSFTFTTLLPTP